MKVVDGFRAIKKIVYPLSGPLVCKTCAETLAARFPGIVLEGKNEAKPAAEEGVFHVRAGQATEWPEQTNDKDNVYFKLDEKGSGQLWSAQPYHLYSFMIHLLVDQADHDLAIYKKGVLKQRPLRWHRATFDQFLNQGGRLIRHFDSEAYIRELARLGFTHVEVNGLAFPMAMESGPRGETYPMFYTYCPAMDQFVYSELNKGIYPYYYLAANLTRLKDHAGLAVKYGLVPGMLCFEPRSVPEQLFERYPMLRGARVDHPFRSFKPRYNLSIVHPMVRIHYAEMMSKLMQQVPQLGFMDIWSNDSGAGFEHTKSLYVGRNGGAYLIREWKDDAEISRLAGENVIRFLQTLRDAAIAVNPDFRVMTRMESFYGEHETVWQGLGDGIDVETNSLFAVGWRLHYEHPKYPEIKEVSGGSIYQSYVDERELPLLQELHGRNALAHFYFSCGAFIIFEPLLGVPYPRLTYQKIRSMHSAGLDCLAHHGGVYPPNAVPYSVNHEIMRIYSSDPEMDLDQALKRIAKQWAGDQDAALLLKVWKLAEEAVLAFPSTVGLYSTFGFTWYRLWHRPLVPNLQAVPEEERAFYEDYICTTPHNPNNVDLSKDVLFALTTPERCEEDLTRMDENLWPPLDQAIQMLAEHLNSQYQEFEPDNVLYDQWIRLRALRCWLRTQHSVAAWIAGVHGYMQATEATEKQRYRAMIRTMMEQEIDNSQHLLELWQTAKVEFMAIADKGETPLIYGRRFGENLQRRIQLMQRHMDDEPYIEPDYIEKMAARMVGHPDLNKVY